MNIVVDFYMPPHLFDSARADNDNESVTERIAKVILESVLDIKVFAVGFHKFMSQTMFVVKKVLK